MGNQKDLINGWKQPFDSLPIRNKKNWAPYLPIAQFAHNNWPSDATRKSLFFLLMGFNPRADWVHTTSPIPRVTLHLEQLKEACIQACNVTDA
jgi:hypothetical protein